jgi:hypothetical protein
VKRTAVAAVVTAVVLLFTAARADAHEVTVICDEATGDLVWSNVFPVDGPLTIVTSNGLTVTLPAEGSVTTEHPGPGTWVGTWEIGEFTAEGEIPPECVETTTTTTVAPTTTVTPTTPPPSEAGSNTVVPPSGSSSSGTLPDTGSDLTVAAVGLALVAGGVLATVVARRRAPVR